MIHTSENSKYLVISLDSASAAIPKFHSNQALCQSVDFQRMMILHSINLKAPSSTQEEVFQNFAQGYYMIEACHKNQEALDMANVSTKQKGEIQVKLVKFWSQTPWLSLSSSLVS